jgi:hypothetical protein
MAGPLVAGAAEAAEVAASFTALEMHLRHKLSGDTSLDDIFTAVAAYQEQSEAQQAALDLLRHQRCQLHQTEIGVEDNKPQELEGTRDGWSIVSPQLPVSSLPSALASPSRGVSRSNSRLRACFDEMTKVKGKKKHT